MNESSSGYFAYLIGREVYMNIVSDGVFFTPSFSHLTFRSCSVDGCGSTRELGGPGHQSGLPRHLGHEVPATHTPLAAHRPPEVYVGLVDVLRTCRVSPKYILSCGAERTQGWDTRMHARQASLASHPTLHEYYLQLWQK